jgi:hypothetical protein
VEGEVEVTTVQHVQYRSGWVGTVGRAAVRRVVCTDFWLRASMVQHRDICR